MCTVNVPQLSLDRPFGSLFRSSFFLPFSMSPWVPFGLPFGPLKHQNVWFYLRNLMVFEKSPFQLLGPFWLLFGLLEGPLGGLFAPKTSADH